MRPRQDFPSIPRRVEDQPKRREGPYYGDRLRRLLAPEPTDPSLVERLTEFYAANTSSPHFWPTLATCVVIAIFLAAVIVTGIAGDLVRWMAS